MNEGLKKIKNYRLIKKIGQGATAEVYEARKEGTLQKFAIKMIRITGLNIKQKEMINKQIQIVKSITHPNIVNLQEAIQTNNNYYLIFQYCQKGDLQQYLKNYKSSLLTEQAAQRIIFCIGDAVALLHSKGIVHRDLKLSNILLKNDCEIKLADFGFAKQTQESFMMKTYCGTPITMAPQILQQKPYDKKCDVWSLGVILFQIVYGKLPFSTNMGYPTFVDLVSYQLLQIPQYPQMPQQFKQLLKGALQKDRNFRYSIEQFISNKWVSEGNVALKQITNNVKSVGQLLRHASNEYQNFQQQNKKRFQDENIEEKQKNIKIQKLVSYRLHQTITNQIYKIGLRHDQMRKKITKFLQSQPFNSIPKLQPLKQLLNYLDYGYLDYLTNNPLILVCNKCNETKCQLTKFKNLQLIQPLSYQKPNLMQSSIVLFQILRAALKQLSFTLKQKKKLYEIVVDFLELMRRFTIKVQLIFSPYHYQQVSVQDVISEIYQGKFNEIRQTNESNYITITLQCHQKYQKIQQIRQTIKNNCLKRIDQIQKQINGFTS